MFFFCSGKIDAIFDFDSHSECESSSSVHQVSSDYEIATKPTKDIRKRKNVGYSNGDIADWLNRDTSKKARMDQAKDLVTVREKVDDQKKNEMSEADGINDSENANNAEILNDNGFWHSRQGTFTRMILDQFEFVEKDGKNGTAKCKLCPDGKTISYVTGNNSNLKKHLRRVSNQ